MSFRIEKADTRQRPRVLMLSADYVPRPWSGIGTAIARQARALAELGVDVDVLVAGGEQRSPADETSRVRVHHLPSRGFPLDPRRFDWVHVHSLRLADLGLELRRRFNVPLACTVHGWPHLEQRGSAIGAHWSNVQRRLLRECDHAILLSRAERDVTLSLADPSGRVSVIPHGVSPPPARLTHQRGIGPIVFAGRFAASKGVAAFAEIAARLLATRQVEIVLAGGHGDACGSAAAKQLADRFPTTCRIAGWLDGPRLDALFARARAVLVPSSYEPFGLVAVEAMRMGAPVLAADVGGLRDIITGDTGGRRIESRDARAWVDAVTGLLDDPRSAARLSLRGPIDVAHRYSSAAMARRLIDEVYQRPVADLRRQGGAIRCHEPRCS